MGRRLFELVLSIKRKCRCNEEQIQEDLGLSQAQFNGLLVLRDGREMTGRELAEHMALSPSRGSRVLGKLAADGYVNTRISPDDRRTLLISLSPKGAEARGQITRHIEACENRICRSLDETTIGRITESLQALEVVL